MTDKNMYLWYAVGALVVIGALWFYMSSGEETTTPTPTSPPAEQTK